MRGISLLISTSAVACALGAVGAVSASALPLFVSKSGTYPIHASFHGGLAKLETSSKEVHCSLVLGLALLGLRLGLYSLLSHKCTTTLLFAKAECNSPGEPKGLIHTIIHTWLGYLTNATGEKMVGMLEQPLSNGVDAEFECEANSLEHVKVTVLGEAVGAIAAAELNKPQSTFNIKFEQSSKGVQTPQTFLLPAPLSLMTGVHRTSDITGSFNEKTEWSEVAEGETTLDGGETAEIQG